MTEIKTNEAILDAFLADYPWRWESKANALKAMQESNDQAVRVTLEMAAEKVDNDMDFDLFEDSINDLHSQVMEKLKTPTK